MAPCRQVISCSERSADSGFLKIDGRRQLAFELTPFSNTRSVTINGLTPGTTYLFQVRALGRSGYTDWSDSATRMSI